MHVSSLTVRPRDLPLRVKLLMGKKEKEYILKKTKRGKLRLERKSEG